MSHADRGDFAADRRLLLLTLVALPIGLTCTGVAWLLVKLIAFFTSVFYAPGFLAGHGPLVILAPVLGGLIIGLMARYGSERIRGHGIPEALEAILFGKSIMSPKVALLKPLSSAISIGSGGPFGAEGPIIMTGGAVGSLVGQLFHLSAAERKILLVAGASAGMAAIFASPIAATLLAVELLLFEWRPKSLVPVALASAVAAAARPFLMDGAGPLFPIPELPAVSASVIAWALLVGVVAGAFSTVLSSSLYFVEDQFLKLKKIHWMWWPAMGGLAVGLGGYLEPRALGVGYDVIKDFLAGGMTPTAAMALVAVKTVIWMLALASGTSGGVLAPLLIMGAGIGVVEAAFLPTGAALWPLVSMAAVMGGMMRSPFTAVLFALELTHSVNALPPLLVGSVASYAFTVLLMKRSILTEKVARRGYDLFREYGVDPLERTTLAAVMTAPVLTVPAGMPVADVARLYFAPGLKHRGYPVVDAAGLLVGILASSDLVSVAGEGTMKSLTVADIMVDHPVVARGTESCRSAADLMAAYGIGRLPIVAPEDMRRLIGIVTRSDLLKARSRYQDEEAKRETIIRMPVNRPG